MAPPRGPSPRRLGRFPGLRHDLQFPQELIRNKARSRQNCAPLEQAYAMVSALPQRAENQLHVSLMENYPGTLEALGEPIRQVGGHGSLSGRAGGIPWDQTLACRLTTDLPTPRATSLCGRGHLEHGCPGKATTGMSSCSATTW